MSKLDHEKTLYDAMGEALPQMPEYMGPQKETLALIHLCGAVTQMTLAGHVPITKLMSLATQALRVAVEAMAQYDSHEEMVNVLLSKTVPRAN